MLLKPPIIRTRGHAAGWSDDENDPSGTVEKEAEMETWLVLEYANRGSLQVTRNNDTFTLDP